MAKVKLTDAAVQRYKAPPGGRANYFDAAIPGFALRVAGPTPRTPAGSRAWVLYYRFGGKQKMLTLEPGYPAQGLAEARRRAGEALQLLGRGEDPATARAAAAAKAEVAARDTVEAVAAEFMTRHMQAKRRAPSYIDDVRRVFDKRVIPAWRGRTLTSITRRDVILLLDQVVDAGTPIAANRTLAAIRKLFNWAIQRGIVEASPAAMIEKPSEETKRDRILSEREIRLFWQAAADTPYPFGPYFHLALLTGQRREEVARLRWQDLDLASRLWTLPAAMTKPGRTQMVPLSPAAAELIAACPQVGPWVFTTRSTSPISGYSKAKASLGAAMAAIAGAAGEEPPLPWTIHDLRRTAATMMGKLGATRFVLARVLNHADGSVTGIYDRHEYLAEKRAALESWARYLENLAQPPGANVVPLRA